MSAPKWIEVSSVRTRYFDVGRGTPVVLIHGGTAGDAHAAMHSGDWEPTFQTVGSSYNAIAFDRLAQGHTGVPREDSDYSIGGSVAHTVAFLRELGRGPYHLVGHAHGGYVSCRITLDHPELVRSCVIISSAACAPAVDRSELVLACNPHAPGTRDSVQWVYDSYSRSNAHISQEWLDSTCEIFALDTGRTAISKMQKQALHEAVFVPRLRVDREELFMRLAARGVVRPVMLIWGAQDPVAPLTSGHRLFELIAARQSRTQLHILNAAGHFCHREQPAAFNRVLLEFLDSVVSCP
jgi:2-hydroxy-6-oxo-6-(2'-aminophenyl)hexa-2,4-dienoate hydrolase